MDESRRQFEEWAGHRYGKDELQIKPDEDEPGEYSDEYVNHLVQGEWEAWQESRQAIEIETPPRINGIHLRQPKEVEDMWLHRLKFAVESAGLKIKGEP